MHQTNLKRRAKCPANSAETHLNFRHSGAWRQ